MSRGFLADVVARLTGRPVPPDPPERPRCRGDCCRALAVYGRNGCTMDPETLAREGDITRRLMAGDRRAGDPPYSLRECDTVSEMLVYLGSFATHPFSGQPAGGAHLYRCKNLQPNGDCGIYETRPMMCQIYNDTARGERACDLPNCACRPLLTDGSST